eukprot:7096191-Prymnesium_polylepis.1
MQSRARTIYRASSLERSYRSLPASIELSCALGVGGGFQPPSEMSSLGSAAERDTTPDVMRGLRMLMRACSLHLVRGRSTTRCPSDGIAADAAA